MNDKYWIEEDMSPQEHSGHWHEHLDGGSHELGAGPPPPPWKHDGVRVIPGNRLDANTAQTPGMDRRPRSTLPAWALKSCGPAP